MTRYRTLDRRDARLGVTGGRHHGVRERAVGGHPAFAEEGRLLREIGSEEERAVAGRGGEACAEHLGGVCPNCGGALVARPPRDEALLESFPASTERAPAVHACP